MEVIAIFLIIPAINNGIIIIILNKDNNIITLKVTIRIQMNKVKEVISKEIIILLETIIVIIITMGKEIIRITTRRHPISKRLNHSNICQS